MADRLIDAPEVRAAIAETLNRVPMVWWDRLTFDANAPEATVYGWIPRGDGRWDFVLITFGLEAETPGVEWFTWSTSSAKYSTTIYRLLHPEADPAGHIECERVEETFGDLVLRKGVNRG